MNARRGMMVSYVLSVLVLSAGCTASEQGTVFGTIVGAGVGAAVGDTEGALVGAAVGGGTGYVVGKQVDQDRRMDNLESLAQQTQFEANTVTINVHNSNGSYTPVTLTRQDNVYIGPRGEYYMSLPTEEQLKLAYGF